MLTPVASTLWHRRASSVVACRLPQKLHWQLPGRWPKSRIRPFRPAARNSERCEPQSRVPHRCGASVAIEVALFDTAVLQRDLAMKRRRDAKDDRALDLCLDSVGIDDNAAIDRTDDAPDTNPPVFRHFDFGNQRHVGR